MNRGIQGNCRSGNYFVFWARDFLTTWRNPKQEFFDLGPSHIPTGESQNGKSPPRGHILAFALRTFSVPDWDRRHNIHICHWFIWGDDSFEILCHFSSFQFLFKPSQIQQNIAFIDKGISLAVVVDIDRRYVTAKFLMNVRTCFYWSQMTVASVVCPPVLEDLLR